MSSIIKDKNSPSAGSGEFLAVTKTRALLEKPFEDLPVSKDLPRLAKQIIVCDSDGTVLRSTEGVQFDIEPPYVHVRDILVTLGRQLCGDAQAETIRSEFDAQMTPDNISLPEVLAKFLKDVVGGDSSPVVAVLKSCNQAAISPAVIELKMALGQENTTKDVSNSWKIIILLRPEENTIQVTNKKRELDIHEEFQFEWEFDMFYDQSTMRCIDIALHVTDLLFAETIKRAKLNEVMKALSRYCTAEVLERKTDSMTVLKAHIASTRRTAITATLPSSRGAAPNPHDAVLVDIRARGRTELALPGVSTATRAAMQRSGSVSAAISPRAASSDVSPPGLLGSSAASSSSSAALLAASKDAPLRSASKAMGRQLPATIHVPISETYTVRLPDKVIYPRLLMLNGERVMHSAQCSHESIAGVLLLTNYRLIFVSDSSNIASSLSPDIASSAGAAAAAAAAAASKVTKSNCSARYLEHVRTHGIQMPVLQIESARRAKNTQLMEIASRVGSVLRFDLHAADRKAAIRTFCGSIFKTMPVEVPRIFAFFYHTSVPHAADGWRIFSWTKEYVRMSIGEGEGSSWRISDANTNNDICKSYPRYLAVPVGISDKELQSTFSSRVENRGPVVVWRNPHTFQTIVRSAVYADFSVKNRIFDEEKLLAGIVTASAHLAGAQPFVFVDCSSSVSQSQWRSRIRLAYGSSSSSSSSSTAAAPLTPVFSSADSLAATSDDAAATNGATVAGSDDNGAATGSESAAHGLSTSGQTPDDSNGRGSQLIDFCHLRLEGHAAQHLAHTKLLRVLADNQSSLHESFMLGAIEQTGWLQLVFSLLKAASQVASLMIHELSSVMILSDQGVDRAAQLSSLVQLMIDPYYRTIDGLVVLIEKEWLSMGHPFTARCGQLRVRQEGQEGPCFILFLECLVHLLKLFPTRFEYNASLLLLIAYHLTSGLYGTFLCDDDRRRRDLLVRMNTVSLWTRVGLNRSYFVNPFYSSEKNALYPTPLLLPHLTPWSITLWTEYYLREHEAATQPQLSWEPGKDEWLLAFYLKYLKTLEPPMNDEDDPPPVLPKRT